jgi:hypothetical protein
MSKYKDIEHDGFEFFSNDDRIDRKKVKKIESILLTELKENEDKVKAEAQRKYLLPENDLLWEGDLDE